MRLLAIQIEEVFKCSYPTRYQSLVYFYFFFFAVYIKPETIQRIFFLPFFLAQLTEWSHQEIPFDFTRIEIGQKRMLIFCLIFNGNTNSIYVRFSFNYAFVCVCVQSNSFNYCQIFDYKFNAQLTLIKKKKLKWIGAERLFKFWISCTAQMFVGINFKFCEKNREVVENGEGLVFLFIFPALNVETYSCKWKNAGGKTFLLTNTKTKRTERVCRCVCPALVCMRVCVCVWGCSCIGTRIYMIFRKHSLQNLGLNMRHKDSKDSNIN